MADGYVRIQNVIDEINANADDLEQNGGIPFAQGARAMAIVVEQMSPADVVPVVRCKDCKNWSREDYGYCFVHASYGMAHDDFCSYGERRGEQDGR